jgi:hypothetical protein
VVVSLPFSGNWLHFTDTFLFISSIRLVMGSIPTVVTNIIIKSNKISANTMITHKCKWEYSQLPKKLGIPISNMILTIKMPNIILVQHGITDKYSKKKSSIRYASSLSNSLMI